MDGRDIGDIGGTIGGIKGLSIIRLVAADIVRHRLVQNIVAAYGPPSPPAEPTGSTKP